MKIISLNIEGNRHLDDVLAFLQTEQADVVCLQEVFAVHVDQITEATGMRAFYTPLSNVTTNSVHADAFGYWGLLQLVSAERQIIDQSAEFYFGSKDSIPIFFENENPNSINRAVSWTKVAEQNRDIVVATTHFTWSPKGEATQEQRRDLIAMESVLNKLPPHILCGDFNAPRGREIFSKLTKSYIDNIPPEVTTTIDGNRHKAGPIQYVVDGLFSSPEIKITDVKIVSGVSDHCAVVGKIA